MTAKKKKQDELPEDVIRARNTLAILKKDKEAIRAAYKIYKNYYVEQLGYTKDAVIGMIADESGRGKSTVWNIVTYQSIYENDDLKTL